MEAKPHPHPAHHVPLSALHCTEHTVHSKVTALSQETSRGRFSSKMTSSHGYPNATELRKHTHLLWSHSLGLRGSVRRNTIILDLLQYRWEQNLALLWERESKVHIGFICLWSEADSFQYLRGLHLNHLWILKTTLLLGITSNSQFLDLLQLDSVLVLIATILLLLRGKWNCNELGYIFLQNYEVTNVLVQLLLRICWILKIILM